MAMKRVVPLLCLILSALVILGGCGGTAAKPPDNTVAEPPSKSGPWAELTPPLSGDLEKPDWPVVSIVPEDYGIISLVSVFIVIANVFVQRGFKIIESTLQEGVKRNIFTEEEVNKIMSRIHGTTDETELADVDLIVEAVFEDEKIKGDLFKRLDAICESHTILATNTSSLYVRNLAKYTNRPDRVIGMHYFYHPAKNRLLEVIPHEGTSNETIEKTL